jgi:hypothetical protein
VHAVAMLVNGAAKKLPRQEVVSRAHGARFSRSFIVQKGV